MSKPNWSNQTIWTGDNLPIMRGMNTASVDLIYLDPPFCSNEEYSAPIGSKAAGASFRDFWTMNDVREEEHEMLEEEAPDLYATIHAASLSKGPQMRAYLIMMGVRLIEMQRILKPTGSILLHCDDHADYQLRAAMDCIFGEKNFRNTVIWQRTKGKSNANRFGRISDTILYYTNGEKPTWNKVYQPHDSSYIKSHYRYNDGDGRGPWKESDPTAPGSGKGETKKPWRGYTPKGRSWTTPTRGALKDYIVENNLIPGWPDAYPSVHQRLDALDKAGLIHWPQKKGGHPMIKYYLAASKGNAACNIITDISPVNIWGKEYVGYPTQKPIKLLNRLIEATSNPGDIVLDPFCGCATACVAAAGLNRQWVGIDISPKAANLVEARLEKELGMFGKVNRQTAKDLKRTDQDKGLTKKQIKARLLRNNGYKCVGCNRDGLEARDLTIDRIVPGANGGEYVLANTQLLCHSCNQIKGPRTMAELKASLKRRAKREAEASSSQNGSVERARGQRSSVRKPLLNLPPSNQELEMAKKCNKPNQKQASKAAKVLASDSASSKQKSKAGKTLKEHKKFHKHK